MAEVVAVGTTLLGWGLVVCALGFLLAPSMTTALLGQVTEQLRLVRVGLAAWFAFSVAPVSMEFRYAFSFGAEPPEAYERLLLDCMLGDTTLFTRADWVLESWRYVSRIHQAWREEKATAVPTYEAGSWGPAEGDLLLARTGRQWRRP